MDTAKEAVPAPRPDRFGRPAAATNAAEALLHQLSAQQEELRTQNAQLVEAQELLHQVLAEYTDLYDHAPVGFVTLDGNGLISRMNFAAEELVKVRRERLAGLPFHKFLKVEHRAAFREHLRRCRKGETRVVTELVLLRSDGRDIPVELISRPTVGEDIPAFRTVIIDLSERKQAEARTAELTAELERRTSEAEQHASRLRALAAKLVEAESAERRRLARNLHDHLQQELIAAKYCLAVARGSGHGGHSDAVKLCDVEQALDRCVDAARQITADLTPPPLQQGAGLPAALRWLADRYAERHGLTVAVAAARATEPASDAVRVMLYEVTRELLLNVVKHAEVSEATVSLTRPAASRLRLSVSDEGRGFEFAELLDRADFVTGFGLFGLRERVENLGGAVEIRSGAGHGTTVTLEVPDTNPPALSADQSSKNVGLIPR